MTSHREDWNDKEYSERELPAALAFWRQYHTPGSRNRPRSAIRYFRKYGLSSGHQAEFALLPRGPSFRSIAEKPA